MKNVILNILVLMAVIFGVQSLEAQVNQLPSTADQVVFPVVGTKLPQATMFNPKGESVDLYRMIQSKKTVLIIYRGGWCPYCNVHLADLKEVQEELQAMGYQIIALSPDIPSKTSESLDKHELGYTLLSDPKSEFFIDLGIAFQAPGRYQNMLNKVSDGMNQGMLPVPGVLLIDTDATIEYAYFNPNYKKRLSNEDLLLAAKSN